MWAADASSCFMDHPTEHPLQMNKHVGKLLEVYSRPTNLPIDWLRPLNPFELAELQREVRVEVETNPGTSCAVQSLEELLDDFAIRRKVGRRLLTLEIAPSPTSCRCFVIADFLADSLRRCEEVQTLNERLMFLIAWLVATAPNFAPESVGLRGFREWESEPPDGNPYDRREEITRWIGYSCSGLYLGSKFREAGEHGNGIRLSGLLTTVAKLSLEALQAESRQHVKPLTRRQRATLEILFDLLEGDARNGGELIDELINRGVHGVSQSALTTRLIPSLRDQGWVIPNKARVGYYLAPSDRQRFEAIDERSQP